MKALHVVAGVLGDAAGRVLLAQRPRGKHLAGLWEFPGGKVEPGESAHVALARELREELGIEAHGFAPLISVPWRYPEKTIRLQALRVAAWRGEPHPHDAQALRWALPRDVDAATMPPADRPLLAALRLPPHYLVTPADADPDALPAMFDAALARGERLFQLRLPGLARDALRALAQALAARCRAAGADLLVNADVGLARELGIGVHLRAAQLTTLEARPLPSGAWVAASCHDAAELARAAELGVDFATLSPLRPTASHPGAPALGWARFATLLEAGALPVYALGGVGPDDLTLARVAGALGVAGIGAFWNRDA
ncbi:MAG: Nudix family hydrolase [Mizugakiibacter sp.]|uniref:Nudix family hydrolase n=1 Tax=Mizugakiibacter sp. TaxID=1972610 RepID=UPI0031C222B4|nr:Nudix family hydrolase [Xanthomonadaceae bacterium]